jgi:hypothetical protein
MAMIPGAAHLFGEPTALEKMAADERRLDETFYCRFSKTPEAEV